MVHHRLTRHGRFWVTSLEHPRLVLVEEDVQPVPGARGVNHPYLEPFDVIECVAQAILQGVLVCDQRVQLAVAVRVIVERFAQLAQWIARVVLDGRGVRLALVLGSWLASDVFKVDRFPWSEARPGGGPVRLHRHALWRAKLGSTSPPAIGQAVWR